MVVYRDITQGNRGMLVVFAPIEGIIRQYGFFGGRPLLLINRYYRSAFDQFTFQELSTGKHRAAAPFSRSHPDGAYIWIGGNRHDISIDPADAFRRTAKAI